MSRIEPDEKDWTWVLERPCPECGFDAAAVAPGELGEWIRSNAEVWRPLLAAPGATSRPSPATWSPTEYAAHVRDVHQVFAGRLQAVLSEERPTFDNWDQDATAIEQDYAAQDPAEVGPALVEAARAVAAAYDELPDAAGNPGDPDVWARPGLRSNGSEFTTLSLGRYHLHDVVHHAWDVRGAMTAATVAAYDQDAAGYREGAATTTGAQQARLDAFAARVCQGARVLEIGSGSGRDATHLEARGVSVRRTDVTPAFVALLRAEGHDADVVDPLVDDLADPARPATPRDGSYDGVWASACLLHVDRTDLATVLSRLAAAVRPGGALSCSLKQGEGDVWSQHGRVGSPRRFVLWREGPLREVVTAAGWAVDTVAEAEGSREEQWLLVTATRPT